MKFRSKPVEIEAVQLTDQFVLDAFGHGSVDVPLGLTFEGWADIKTETHSGIFLCASRQGVVNAELGDWIIVEPGAPALCYPCKDDVFKLKYFEVPVLPVDPETSGEITHELEFAPGQTPDNTALRLLFSLLDKHEKRVRDTHPGQLIGFGKLDVDKITREDGAFLLMVREQWSVTKPVDAATPPA